MSRSPHLLLALSGHGYGHLAQAAPVVNALRKQIPELVLSVCGSLPRAVVAGRINGKYDYRQIELDPVLSMRSAWEVDVETSRQVFRRFHHNWQSGLRSDFDLLQQMRPDLVLADIPYRILVAADQRSVPAVALCSLNWAGIYAAYSENSTEDLQFIEQMVAAYGCADYFLAPTPSMLMPNLGNVTSIGPIARTGSRQRTLLADKCSTGPEQRKVLVALGGIAMQLPLDKWPCIEGISWIFTEPLTITRADFINFDSLDMRFIDVLASVDVVVTKPGYGTYAEAVCNGVPVLSIERPDWPETAFLNGWVLQHGHLEVMTVEQFYAGQFAQHIVRLLGKPAFVPPQPAGIAEAVSVISRLL